MVYQKKRLVALMQERLLEDPRSSLSEIARDLGVHRHTLATALSEFEKRPFRTLRRERVLKIAIRLLTERSNLSEKEIAFELGYLWPESFSRFVKRYTGKTPTEIRESSCRS